MVSGKLANVVSNSWGISEPFAIGMTDGFEQVFRQAAAEHITILASSGDQEAQELSRDKPMGDRGRRDGACSRLSRQLSHGNRLVYLAAGQLSSGKWGSQSPVFGSGGGGSGIFRQPAYQRPSRLQ